MKRVGILPVCCSLDRNIRSRKNLVPKMSCCSIALLCQEFPFWGWKRSNWETCGCGQGHLWRQETSLPSDCVAAFAFWTVRSFVVPFGVFFVAGSSKRNDLKRSTYIIMLHPKVPEIF